VYITNGLYVQINFIFIDNLRILYIYDLIRTTKNNIILNKLAESGYESTTVPIQ